MIPAIDVLNNTQNNPSSYEIMMVEKAIWEAQNADESATSVVLPSPPSTQMVALLVASGYSVDGSTVIWTHDTGIIPPEEEAP